MTGDITIEFIEAAVERMFTADEAVPAWLKRQAYAEYGITQYKTGDYEVDHLSCGVSN